MSDDAATPNVSAMDGWYKNGVKVGYARGRADERREVLAQVRAMDNPVAVMHYGWYRCGHCHVEAARDVADGFPHAKTCLWAEAHAEDTP